MDIDKEKQGSRWGDQNGGGEFHQFHKKLEVEGGKVGTWGMTVTPIRD